MNVSVYIVPYDAGHERVRMEAGPDHLGAPGTEALRDRGYCVDVERLTADAGFTAEIRTAFALHRQLAERVRTACTAGAFPFVLSGNCNSALGTIAGIGPSDLGIVWLDGHVDANTPETTTSGSLDGMGVATAVGRCWTRLAATIPRFAPVPADRVLYIGCRDIDPDERTWIDEAGVAVVEATRVKQVGVAAAISPALDSLRNHVPRVYLHVDLDVLDPVPAPANELAPPDGLTVGQVEEVIRFVGERFAVAAAGIASYDPACDHNDAVLAAGIRVMTTVVTAHHGSD